MDKGYLGGVWTAIVTPFHADGSLDLESYEKLVAHQIEGGIEGIVVSGTTGESPTLSVQEKLSLIKKTKAVAGSKVRIMAGSGGNNTAQSVELSKLCVDAGASSLLVVTPPYNKPGPSGLKAHYKAISDATNVPIVLYHVPSRTGAFVPANVLLDVLQNKSIQAVKEASGDLPYFSKVAMNTEASLLSGDDFTFLPTLACGGKGVVSVVTNVFPKAFIELNKAFRQGHNEKALQIHNALFEFTELLFKEPNPAPTKAALSIMGLCKNYLRLPLTPVEDDTFQEIEHALEVTKKQLTSILN